MDEDQNETHSGLVSGLFLGIILGGAAGYFFSTEKGKAILQDALENAEDKFEDLKSNKQVQQFINKTSEIKDEVQKTIREAKLDIEQSSPAPSQLTSPELAKKKPRLFQRAGSPLKP